MIYCFSLDDISDKGKTKGRIQGTKSNTVLEKLNSFVEITVDILKSEDVNLRKIEACLKKGGVAICSIYDSDAKKGCGHSVLVIDCDNEWVYIWDPYPYTKHKISSLMPEVDFTEYGKSPQKANIKITRKRFDSYKVKPFSLCEKDRECCLMYRNIS
jgi:hypothetical protein